jgi:hypothetical protein
VVYPLICNYLMEPKFGHSDYLGRYSTANLCLVIREVGKMIAMARGLKEGIEILIDTLENPNIVTL